MTNIRTKHFPIIVILLVIFAATLTGAFTPSIYGRNSRNGQVGDSSKIGDRSPNANTSRQRPSLHAPTTTSLMDSATTQRNGTTSSHTSSSRKGSQSTTPGQKNGILSSTARESAVTAEWEPILELQRHVEEGNYFGRSHECGGNQIHDNRCEEKDKIEVVKGVFVGYRVTKEECLRLRSANPDDFSNYSI